jgi:surface carbohydrate biosynthesis protein (TIGR04326 family)
MGSKSRAEHNSIVASRSLRAGNSEEIQFVLDEYFASSLHQISVPELVDNSSGRLKNYFTEQLDAITSVFWELTRGVTATSQDDLYSLLSVSRLNWNGSQALNTALKAAAIFMHQTSFDQSTSAETFDITRQSIVKSISESMKPSRRTPGEALVWLTWRAISHLALRGTGEYDPSTKSWIVSFPEDELGQSDGAESRFWGNLPGLTTRNGIHTNWLFLPDHAYSRGALAQAARRVAKSDSINHYVHADDLVSLRDLAGIFAKYVTSLPNRLATFRKANRKLRGTLVYPLIRDELFRSWVGQPFLESLYFKKLFSKISSDTNTRLFYPLENQTWEKHLNSTHCNRGALTFGVSHSTTRFWDLRLTHDSSLDPNRFLPTTVIANSGASSADLARLVKGSSTSVKNLEALRFQYLARPRLKSMDSSATKLLVCLGYNSDVSRNLLKVVIASAEEGTHVFRIRFHPGAPQKSFPNLEMTTTLELSKADLETDLNWCDSVISDSMSSISFEALHLGKQAVLFRDGSTPNMSPLFGSEHLPVFWDSVSLRSSLDAQKTHKFREELGFFLEQNDLGWLTLFTDV